MDNREHVFIAGSGRSGTTLLASILLSSGVYAVYRAETKLLDECPLKYGRITSDSAYSSFVQDWFSSRQFHRSGLTEDEFNELVAGSRGSYARILGKFMGAIADRQGKSLWVEDTPSNAFRLKEISQAFPNARVIHIVRDGRAVALSLAKLGWTGVSTGNYRKGLCYSALKWEQSVRAIHESSHHLGDRFMEVRYEDLVTDPRGVISEVGNFLGIDIAADKVLGAGQDESVENRQQPVPMKSNTAFGDVDSGISSRPAYRWKEQLSHEEQALLNSYIGSTLLHCDYPVTFNHEMSLVDNITMHFRRFVLRLKRAIKYHTPVGRITPSPLEINQV